MEAENQLPLPPKPSLIKRGGSWPPIRRHICYLKPREYLMVFNSYDMNKPPENFLTFDDVQVQDALAILRISLDMVFELRRKYSNDMVPMSEKSSGLKLTLEQVVRYLLNAIRPRTHRTTDSGDRLVTAKDQDPPSVIVQALDLIGIPKCHQSFAETFVKSPDVTLDSFIILMSLFFNPEPQPPYTA